MRTSRIVALAAVAALALSACSHASKPEARPTHAPKVWKLTYDGSGSQARIAADARASSFDGTSLVIEYTDRARSEDDRAGTFDVTTGKRTDRARVAYPGGQIIGVERTGAWLVYGEESSRGIYTPGQALWRIVALGPHAQRKVLATSGGKKVTMSPDLDVLEGAAAWTTYPDAHHDFRTFSWRPSQRGPHREDVDPGDANECTPSTTHPELVGACFRTDDWIAWTEQADPKTETADTNDPRHLFFSGGGPQQKLADLDDFATDLVIFGDYLVWENGHGVMVTDLRHPAATVRVGPSANIDTFLTDGRTAVVVREKNRSTTAEVIDPAHLHLVSD
ncbi:MAG: hypothetical protein ACJ72E_08120 [Marmoricola sp.]